MALDVGEQTAAPTRACFEADMLLANLLLKLSESKF